MQVLSVSEHDRRNPGRIDQLRNVIEEQCTGKQLQNECEQDGARPMSHESATIRNLETTFLSMEFMLNISTAMSDLHTNDQLRFVIQKEHCT
jgi:hypothetical protein